jgi:hypothetical protein
MLGGNRAIEAVREAVQDTATFEGTRILSGVRVEQGKIGHRNRPERRAGSNLGRVLQVHSANSSCWNYFLQTK